MFDLSKIEGMVDAAGKPFHMLIVMDHYSKYLWSDIVRGKDPEPIADFLKKTFKREGTPERWHADNGGEFRNEVMNMVRRELSKHDPNNDMLPFSRSTPRHPECQGLVEKQNDTMKRKIYKGVVDEFNQYVIRFVWKFKTYVRIQVPGYDHTHYRLTIPDGEDVLPYLKKLLDDLTDSHNKNPILLYGGVSAHMSVYTYICICMDIVGTSGCGSLSPPPAQDVWNSTGR
jgi:hypothetical protein